VLGSERSGNVRRPVSDLSQTPDGAEGPQPPGSRGAVLVGLGIGLSRILGLVRERLLAHYLGNSLGAAAFRAGQRIPNYLQNLFGEGVLSGSFIPVYAGLLGKGDPEEADRLAGAIFGLLSVAVALLVAAGVLGASLFVDVLTPGLGGETRDLAVALVRIAFPGTGLLVLSAWCLGILNSHRKFFLSYAAPVLWNLAIIAGLLLYGRGRDPGSVAAVATWGGVAGSALQLGIQVPTVMKLLGRFLPTVRRLDEHVIQVLRSFGPVVIGRGVVQISAFVDGAVATLISDRAYSAISYAQLLYLLPVSLFGMAVSAAELPEMSRAVGASEQVEHKLRTRLDQGARRIAFFVVPSVVAFAVLGDVVGGTVLQTGRFGPSETRYLWYLLVGSTVGLLAATLARLYASAFYAVKDTKTPLKFAATRVALGAALSFGFALWVPEALGLPKDLGAAIITAASGLAAWVEFLLLKRKFSVRIGPAGAPGKLILKLWAASLGAALVGVAVKWGLTQHFGVAKGVLTQWGGSFLPAPAMNGIAVGLCVLIPYGIVYFANTYALRIPEALGIARRVIGRSSR